MENNNNNNNEEVKPKRVYTDAQKRALKAYHERRKSFITKCCVPCFEIFDVKAAFFYPS